MTEGSPFRLLTAFTLPALAGNLLNQVYSRGVYPSARMIKTQALSLWIKEYRVSITSNQL